MYSILTNIIFSHLEIRLCFVNTVDAQAAKMKKTDKNRNTEEVNVDFLKIMNAAKLVQFMMDLVIDQCLIIISRIVPYNVIH